MSTKIYNAYKYIGKGGLEGLVDHLEDLRTECILSKDVSTKIAEAVADCQLDKPNVYNSKFFDALTKSSFTSISCSVWIYMRKGKLYLIFHGIPRGVSIDPKLFEDFHYQNQCDPWYEHKLSEGSISHEDYNSAIRNWNFRRKVWDEVLGAAGCTSTRGLLFEFITDHSVYQMSNTLFRIKKSK